MNQKIINNLFEFWSEIGTLTNTLIATEHYKAVSMMDSDWPNRIYAITDREDIYDNVLMLSQKGKLPELITISQSNNLNNRGVELISGQKNMALQLKLLTTDFVENANIFRVETTKDSLNFATTASEAFGYRVDSKIILAIIKNSENIQLYNYIKDRENLGCGIVFFDTNNNAGLHMIGTIPKGRGQGIGKRMTERLLIASKHNNKDLCVLHASLMGESIYIILGFESFGEIKTYKILRT